MIDTPKIVETEAVQTAVVRLTIPKDRIQHEMGPGRAELFAALEAQGVEPAGPWFTRHFRIEPTRWDFEIGVPVKRAVAPTGRVTPGSLPAATVARTVYRGPFEGLGGAWGELGRWIAAQGKQEDPSLWEVYVAGPEVGPDPSKWATELNRPLVA